MLGDACSAQRFCLGRMSLLILMKRKSSRRLSASMSSGSVSASYRKASSKSAVTFCGGLEAGCCTDLLHSTCSRGLRPFLAPMPMGTNSVSSEAGCSTRVHAPHSSSPIHATCCRDRLGTAEWHSSAIGVGRPSSKAVALSRSASLSRPA